MGGFWLAVKSLRTGWQLLSKRGRHLPDPVKPGRAERRTAATIAVGIAGLHPPAAEVALTENVSPHGARILSKRKRDPNELLMIASLAGNFRARARVVYCQSLPDHTYATGLALLEPNGEWIIAPQSIGTRK